MADGEVGRDCLAFGAVIALAELIDCVLLTSLAKAYHDVAYDWCRPCGPVCWVLSNVKRLRQPVACRGGQRLWTVPPDVVAAAEARV